MEHVRDALYTDGIAALRGAFSIDWVACMRQDIATAFADAVMRPGGAVPRGPQRYYVEIHPGQLRGYVELVTHPWVVGVCETVLGRDYQIVELGFDIPFPGAMNQPWHRDFPSPLDTYEGKRLTSLAFNLTAVAREVLDGLSEATCPDPVVLAMARAPQPDDAGRTAEGRR